MKKQEMTNCLTMSFLLITSALFSQVTQINKIRTVPSEEGVIIYWPYSNGLLYSVYRGLRPDSLSIIASNLATSLQGGTGPDKFAVFFYTDTTAIPNQLYYYKVIGETTTETGMIEKLPNRIWLRNFATGEFIGSPNGRFQEFGPGNMDVLNGWTMVAFYKKPSAYKKYIDNLEAGKTYKVRISFAAITGEGTLTVSLSPRKPVKNAILKTPHLIPNANRTVELTITAGPKGWHEIFVEASAQPKERLSVSIRSIEIIE